MNDVEELWSDSRIRIALQFPERGLDLAEPFARFQSEQLKDFLLKLIVIEVVCHGGTLRWSFPLVGWPHREGRSR